MSRRAIAGTFTLLLVFSVMMGSYSTISMPTISGFQGSDLRMPGDFSAASLPPLPSNIAGDTTARPEISMRILIGQIYEEYGGSVRIIATNNDTRLIFLEEVRFEWVGTDLESSIIVNQGILPKEKHEIKSLMVHGPPVSGLREYRLSIRLLQYRTSHWYRMVSGGDEWLEFSEQTIDVMPLSEMGDNPVIYNPRNYYAKVNGLVNFSSSAVASAAETATEGLAAGYDMGEVCAIFDWLLANVNYTEDPGDGDAWYSPDETLSMMAGDCEDYAMLLAAMVNHAGGTSRIILTKDHAFAAVYIGSSASDLDNATEDIQAYYGTTVPVHAFTDDTGYWMAADPLGSFHMGGLAVGQAPIVFADGMWDTRFPDSGRLYSIDVTGKAISLPLWLDPIFWLGMIVIFGTLALIFVISAHSTPRQESQVCRVCGNAISADLYECPICRAPHHRACAYQAGHCASCGNAVVYPPPPPIQLPPGIN